MDGNMRIENRFGIAMHKMYGISFVCDLWSCFHATFQTFGEIMYCWSDTSNPCATVWELSLRPLSSSITVITSLIKKS